MEFVKLTLRTDSKGYGIWIAVQKPTAELFGWTEAFPTWSPGRYDWETGKQTRYLIRKGSRPSAGGHRLRICRSEDKGGWIAGMTHCFRISKQVSEFDLAELAWLTKGDWGWMETRYHERRSRDQWRALYEGASMARY